MPLVTAWIENVYKDYNARMDLQLTLVEDLKAAATSGSTAIIRFFDFFTDSLRSSILFLT